MSPIGSFRTECVKAEKVNQSGTGSQVGSNEGIRRGSHGQIQIGFRLELGWYRNVDPMLIPGYLIPAIIRPHPELYALNPENARENVIASFWLRCKQSV